MATVDRFKFKKLDTVGAAAAEEDDRYLFKCFIETGDLAALRDFENTRRIIVGRTGSGKSALILKLAELEKGRSIVVQPESLALAYISNSTILRFLGTLGLNLDVFYRLLWRHVFTVEVLKRHFKIRNEPECRSFFARFIARFSDKKHQQAIEYLRDWGEHFWEETEYRIKETTTKLETDLRAELGAEFSSVKLGADAARKVSEEQRLEIIERAQKVVNKVQIRQLSDIMDAIRDVLETDDRSYYILIDRLDEQWVDDELRFRLIRALIETVKDFNKVRRVKVIIAIRIDLLERVYRNTRDTGFQEEKYESMYLPLHWTKQRLTELVNARVSQLVQSRYTKQPVTLQDVLPGNVNKIPALDYILERTMMRPRDVIAFVNFAIERADNRGSLSAEVIREAEGAYSRDRLRSLADEWVADLPNLADFIVLLRDSPKEFFVKDISDHDCEKLCFEILDSEIKKHDALTELVTNAFNGKIPYADFRKQYVQILHRVGVLGLKPHRSEAVCWSFAGRRTVSASEIGDETKVVIHPAFYRVLNINPMSR